MSTATPPPLRLEIAAALLVPSAAFGFIRVFSDAVAIRPIIGASFLATGLAIVARRLRVPLFLSALLSVLGLVLLIVRRYAPGTAGRGVIPTSESLDVLNVLLDEGVAQFRVLRAPVEPLDPFVAAAIIGCWAMAFLTDWGAMRLRLAFEPVLPAGLLFVFTAVLGSGDHRLISTLVFVVGVVTWAIVQRTVHLGETAVWLRADARRGPGSLVRGSVALCAIALVAGLVGGARLPGAQSDEWYTWRNEGDPVRQVISPYVSIAARLTEQRSTRLFTVRSERPAYWRLAGLDEYRDSEWVTRGVFERASGELPGRRPGAGTTITVRQQVTVEALDAIWLPAAFAPSTVLESTADITWNADTGSLTVDGNSDTSDGVSYTIESVVPVHSPEELRAANGPIPPDIAERFLPLPADLSPRVASEAAEITAGATTDYDRMMALQAHFRAYDYSVSLSERVGDPIDQFLDERVGFCQQFSGTFALMARTLGVPARVAVGFTWGDPVDGEPGLYSVSGRQAHAWPEVWFPDLGWVAFEPTPGRGGPDATHLAIPAAQDSAVQPDRPGEPTTTTTISPSDLAAGGPDLSFDPALGLPSDSAIGEAATGESAGSGRLSPLLLVLLVGGLYVAGSLAFHRLRRARRTRSATTTEERTELAWAEAAEAIELSTGLVRPRAMTRREWAQRLARDQRVEGDDMRVLADAVTTARFSGTLPAETLEAAESASERLTRQAQQRMGWRKRLLVDLDPRRLRRPTQRLVQSPPTDDTVGGSTQGRREDTTLVGAQSRD